MRQVIEVGETAAGTVIATSSGVRWFTSLLGLVFSLVSFGFRLGEARLKLFQSQRQLSVVDFLRLATELSAPDFGYDRLKLLVSDRQLVTFGAEPIALGDKSGMVGKLSGEQRAQRLHIIGKYVTDTRHRLRRLTEDEPSCC
jgi:hypothetical protein